MKVLVTGASGFLGRHVVEALRRAGHLVRALDRSWAVAGALEWDDTVQILHADLSHRDDLRSALDGVDAVIHLAALMSGSAEERFHETVRGTERFLETMTGSGVKRLLLCSSFSVYDWLQADGCVNEDLLLSDEVRPSGGYAAAKRLQEHLAARFSREHGFELTVVRPGFLWGRGNPNPPGSTGFDVGSLHFVIGGGRRPPFTHVENCADCLRVAVETPNAVARVYNVVDNHGVTAWQFMGEFVKRSGVGGIRIPVPYAASRLLLAVVRAATQILPGLEARLPGIFVPSEFAERCRPLRYSTARLERELGWRPPLDFRECLERTYGVAVSQG